MASRKPSCNQNWKPSNLARIAVEETFRGTSSPRETAPVIIKSCFPPSACRNTRSAAVSNPGQRCPNSKFAHGDCVQQRLLCRVRVAYPRVESPDSQRSVQGSSYPFAFGDISSPLHTQQPEWRAAPPRRGVPHQRPAQICRGAPPRDQSPRQLPPPNQTAAFRGGPLDSEKKKKKKNALSSQPTGGKGKKTQAQTNQGTCENRSGIFFGNTQIRSGGGKRPPVSGLKPPPFGSSSSVMSRLVGHGVVSEKNNSG